MKGAQTRAQILDSALRLMSLEGLDALSIGKLAKSVGLSKSGLFAHFNSKEALQKRVLERASEAFVAAVVLPALKKPRGLARLKAMFNNWLTWASDGSLPGGCVFIGAAVELDDKPGKLRDYLVQEQKNWLATLARAVTISIEEDDLNGSVAPDQIAFEIYGLMMSYHLHHRLLRDKRAKARAKAAFERVIEASQ